MKRVIALTGLAALAAGLVWCVFACGQWAGPATCVAESFRTPGGSIRESIPAEASGGHSTSVAAQPVNTGPSPNADIQIKPTDGEWVISVIVYKGPEAHTFARQFVSLLRSEEYKKMWAFVQ